MSVVAVIRSGFLFPALSREERAELVRDARKRIERAEARRRDDKAERDDKRAARKAEAKAQAKRDAKKGKS